ncbi:MAG: CHASE2 domain-containing protein [Rhodospirillaceae bacterium]
MRDDVRAEGDARGRLGRVAGAAGNAFRGIPWRNALSGKWWWRWFNRSMIQSGRVTTLLALLGILVIRIDDPNVLQVARAQVFDLYLKIKPRVLTEDSPVRIITVDQKSVDELGQFPWPRSVMGDLVTNATALGADVIGFDIVFADADQTSVSKVVDAIPRGMIDDALRDRLKNVPTNDTVFGEAIAKSGKVVLGQTLVTENMTYPDAAPLTSFATVGDDPKLFIERHPGVLRPLSVIDSQAAGRGVFSVSGKFFDGIVRQVPMMVSSQGELYPSLALEMLRVKIGGRTIGVASDAKFNGITQIFIRPPRSRDRFVIKTDEFSQVWPYYRPHSAWVPQYVSATDVIHNRLLPDALKGKFVLVGMSAQGLLNDMRSTPLDPVLPGVEVHGNIIESVVFDTQLKRPGTAILVEWASTAVIALLMIIITPMVGIGVGFGIFAAISAGLTAWSWNAFSTKLELFDPSFPVITAFLIYAFLAFAGYLRTESQRKQVRSAFGQYLSPDLVQKLAEDPSKLALGGENRDMTFMFSDIRGFTSISELFDAQGLTRLINRLLTPLTNVILSNRGTIDKYMGDCVMAFWNAPLEVKDHAASACRAALGMVEEVKKVNVVLEAEAKQEGREHRKLAVGIGVNSGIACVGNMGSEQRFDYSVLGDNVNLASRLEGQSKNYGVTIVLGENTAVHADGFAVLELDLIKVKGKAQAVRIFTLVGDSSVAATGWFKELKIHHDAALTAYRAQAWDAAESEIAACRKILEGQTGLPVEMLGFYAAAVERIEAFRAVPPPKDWDGVYVADSK